MRRIGHGLYAKTKVSSVNGKIVLAEPLPLVAREALKRLGVQTVQTKAEIDYEEGRSTQVPTGRMIGVKNRVLVRLAITIRAFIMRKVPGKQIVNFPL